MVAAGSFVIRPRHESWGWE